MKSFTKPPRSRWRLKNFWQIEQLDRKILPLKRRFFKRKRKKRFLSYYRIKSTNFRQNFTNVILNKGLKLKYNNEMSKTFQLFFFFFKKSNPLFTEYSNFFKWVSFSKNYPYFYSIDFLIRMICTPLIPRFTIQCEKVPKKLKKKIKTKYQFKLKYVQFHNDFKKILKWLYYYSKYFNKTKLSDRLFHSLFITFFEEKKSFLYSKKIRIYKKMLKKSRARDNV